MENLRDKKEKTVNKLVVTWQSLEEFISWLAIQTDNFTQFNGVYGPARGGLVFAVIISNRYNLPFLGAPQIGCLVVDDIVDSGVTASKWKSKGYTIASMYYKKNNVVTPDYWFAEKTNEWIQFPFE